jgi:hypothetical protein
MGTNKRASPTKARAKASSKASAKSPTKTHSKAPVNVSKTPAAAAAAAETSLEKGDGQLSDDSLFGSSQYADDKEGSGPQTPIKEEAMPSRNKRGRPKGPRDLSKLSRETETNQQVRVRFQDFLMSIAYAECQQLKSQKSFDEQVEYCKRKYCTLAKCWLGRPDDDISVKDVQEWQKSVDPLFDNKRPTTNHLFGMNSKSDINYKAVLNRVKSGSDKLVKHEYIPKLRLLTQNGVPASGIEWKELYDLVRLWLYAEARSEGQINLTEDNDDALLSKHGLYQKSKDLPFASFSMLLRAYEDENLGNWKKYLPPHWEFFRRHGPYGDKPIDKYTRLLHEQKPAPQELDTTPLSSSHTNSSTKSWNSIGDAALELLERLSSSTEARTHTSKLNALVATINAIKDILQEDDVSQDDAKELEAQLKQLQHNKLQHLLAYQRKY